MPSLVLFLALLALGVSALFALFGLTPGSAYGGELDGDGASSRQIFTASKTAIYNVEATNSYTCDDPGTTYTIIGGSTNGSTVTIKGGSEQNPIRVTLDNMTIDQGAVSPSSAPITVESGYAIITLRGANTLKAGYKDVSLQHDRGFAGLCVQSGAACVITSVDGDGSTAGSLEARGGHNKYGGAGIGTNYNDNTGTIIIRGGTIRAYGAYSAAGIGSGRDGECNTVSIEGGDVWAWGGKYGAGIGGGDAVAVGNGGWTHDVRVSGGTVHAYGGDNGGAGIGGSEGGGTDSVTITGGNITAIGCGEQGSSGSAAGIGSGDGGVCSTINISQGSGELTIDAQGYGEGAGIGGANCSSGTINIALNGGSVTAKGGPKAAGIGSGESTSGTINMSGRGTVTAFAGSDAAAIGASDQDHAGAINIIGAGNESASRLTVNAYAPTSNAGEHFVSEAAIIGSGDGTSGDITIKNADVNLRACTSATLLGAGIGTGSSNDLSLKDGGIDKIHITNATIRFSGIYIMDGAGIGAGYGSNIDTIALDNVDYDGPAIGSSNSDRFGTDENSMSSISIANSTVRAIARDDANRNRNHAGVGTGPYGTIGSITITNSAVEAKGVHGGAGIGSGGLYVNGSQPLHSITSTDGKCGDVTIVGGTVTATGNEGGAGIGAGTLASVEGAISISGGATVVATGGGSNGGAGIGGGKLCSCADITIDGANVTAAGGAAAAGIGSGGVDDTTFISGVVQTTWNTICGNITISGSSNVTATGGAGAAGIGLGQGAQMESSSWIKISGGVVNAQGGARGAGIGAGRESGWGRGAEARRIKIEGAAKVEATGGAGAAGIGGGYEGGLEHCIIGLSVNDPDEAFVIARAGVGAAGIGGGASSRKSSDKGTIDGAHDAKSITISGGFVAAYGGNGSESSSETEGRTGPGAGIGGGSFQGDLEDCTISGGVVVARAGANASGGPSGPISAEDIGHGGCRGGVSGSGDGSDSIRLTGGTVVGKINQHEDVIVSGGSVTHRFVLDQSGGARCNGAGVYQNTMTVSTSNLSPDEFAGYKFYNLGKVSTSADYYNGNSIFAVAEENHTGGRARAYLYLPAGDQDASTATIKPADVELYYYGTTVDNYNDSTKNVLKMGAPIVITPKRRSAELIEGEPYQVRVADMTGTLGIETTVAYGTPENAEFVGYYTDDGATLVSDMTNVPLYTVDSAGNKGFTDVTVTPGAAGKTMKLTAQLNGSAGEGFDDEIYWGDGQAVYEDVIHTAPPTVKITNDPTKVYDGDAAPITYEAEHADSTWCKYTGTCLNTNDPTQKMAYQSSEPPTQIGTYTATVWAQQNLEGGKTRTVTDFVTFSIEPYTLELTLTAQSKVVDGQPAEVSCTASAAQANPLVAFDENGMGTIELSYYRHNDEAQDGDAWTYLGTTAPATVGEYAVVAKGGGNPYYTEATAKARYSILENKLDPYLFVDMPQTFVYDGQPVDEKSDGANGTVQYPIVWTGPGYDQASITFEYYEGSDPSTGRKLEAAPTNAGDYCVVVSVPETERYNSASATSAFTILKRPASLAIAATGDQSNESAEVVVTLSNVLDDVVTNGENNSHVTLSVAYDDSASTQSLNGASLTAQSGTTVDTPIAKDGDSYVASHGFADVGAGQYEVTASFENPNYDVQSKTEHFDKRMRSYRVAAQDKTVTFGDASFAIQAEVWDSNGTEVQDPELSYSQVSNADIPAVTSDSAVLGDGGTVNVCNAGLSAIRVDKAGDRYHEGDFDYAVITVEKATLPLSVSAQGKVADGKPAEVSYSVDDSAYPKSYSGDVALTYFRESGGVRTKLDSAPVESGSYAVVATAGGDRNYNSAVAEADFVIQAASDPDDPNKPDNPDNPVNPDNPDNPVNPDNPDNPVNPVNPNDPDNPTKPDTKPTSGNDPGSSTGSRTGDGVLVWPLAASAVLGLVAAAYSARRMRASTRQSAAQRGRHARRF